MLQMLHLITIDALRVQSVRGYWFIVLSWIIIRDMTIKAVHVCRCKFIFFCELFGGVLHLRGMFYFTSFYFISLLFHLLLLYAQPVI